MPRRLRLTKRAGHDASVACEMPQPATSAISPRLGDVIVRAIDDRIFEVVDAVTLKPVSDRFGSLGAAIAVARLQGQTIWRQTFDRSGRATASPTLLDS